MSIEFMHSPLMHFWKYARNRQQIFLDRKAGKPAPWTNDSILANYRFCNIFREDDKVTLWVKKHIRTPLRSTKGDLVFALIAARLFNLPSTLEQLLPVLQPGCWSKAKAKKAIEGLKPVVNGAYIIIGRPGFAKGDGIIEILDDIYPERHAIHDIMKAERSLERAVEIMAKFERMGDFLAYEVATDLRHTSVLRNATDIMTWANPGPGAARGLSRLIGEDKDHFNRGSKRDRAIMMELMQELLWMANNTEAWPKEWPRWEMREVEHTLCEVDKYLRVAYGEGRPKQGYRAVAE